MAKVPDKEEMQKEEVAAISDGFNDYSIFNEFSISFTMENAISEIKEIAKYIIDTDYNSSVAKAINKVLREY